MRIHLYQIFDLEAQTTIGNIIATPRAGAAIRSFRDILGHENTPMEIRDHVTDFVLLELGWQDTESGEIEGITPTPVYSGTDYLKELAARDRASSALAANDNGAANASEALQLNH